MTEGRYPSTLRERSAAPARGKPDAFEDASGDHRVLNRGDEPQRGPAAGTPERVEAKDALKERGPREPSRAHLGRAGARCGLAALRRSGGGSGKAWVVRCTGIAPDRLRFELSVRPHRAPLLAYEAKEVRMA